MFTKIRSSKFLALALVLGLSLVTSFVIHARAQVVSVYVYVAADSVVTTSTGSGIIFPISELGNCSDKESCREYCSDTANIPACIQFAKAHGLMNDEEAGRAKKFVEDLRSGGGPGGCMSGDDCNKFCSDIKNLEVCVKFAESHGVKDKHTEHGKKILDFIKAGGQTPGGCTSEETCKEYCSDFNHAEECFNFAKSAGIAQVKGEKVESSTEEFGDENENNIPGGQFQKFLDLVKAGQTPGGCKSKDECESYCKDQNHFEECVAFGERVGFIAHDKAQKIREAGGKGPGGCASEEACKMYCSEADHHGECYKFAEDHGFINKDQSDRAKEGLVRLREGFDEAPAGVRACLKSVLGENVIEDIQSGKIAPGSDIGDRVKQCFVKFGEKRGVGDYFKKAPPEVLVCVKEKLGDEYWKIISGTTMPTPEDADVLRACFGKSELNRHKPCPENPIGLGPPCGGEEKRGEHLRGAPPAIQECLKEKLGDNYQRILESGVVPSPDMKQKMIECYNQFRKPSEEQKPPEDSGEGAVPDQ